ncbi:MAG TPA: cell division protein ZapB [Bryobacteraceae bacterium]|nr:cell division protein ZapB [Bryobacteraceae bacterium]
MRSKSSKFPWLAPGAMLLALSVAASAQTAPQVEQILNRLDQLEKDNQTLIEEVRSLRQEIAGLRAQPGPAAQEHAQNLEEQKAGQEQKTPEQTTADRQAVITSRVDELAQTKVESSEKFPIRITGMALFNASVNGRFNGNAENPLVASRTPGEMTGDGTLRQSTLGLLFNGPQTFANGKISGSLYMDFFAGSTASLDHLIRLRTAAVNIDWKNTSVMVGQDKPLLSPRDPTSFAQVAYSPLTGAGNLWLWQPQGRVEQRFSLGDSSGIRAQANVIVTSSLDYAAPPYTTTQPSQQQEYSSPGAEGRLEFWHRWSANGRLEIAGGYHFNQNRIVETLVPTEVYSADWFFRPVSRLEFSGTVFHGRNVATLGSLPQGVIVRSYQGNIIGVHSTGGWAQIRVPITSRLAWDVYGGQQDDRNSDLGFGNIAKNQGYFSNLIYRIAPNVLVSLEGGQVRTTYLGLGNRLNDHYDLGLAYLF